jgi:hypothetical protein
LLKLSKESLEKAHYKHVPREEYKQGLVPAMGDVVAEEFVQMLEYIQDFGYYGGASLSEAKELNPSMHTFEQWLKDSDWKGPQ